MTTPSDASTQQAFQPQFTQQLNEYNEHSNAYELAKEAGNDAAAAAAQAQMRESMQGMLGTAIAAGVIDGESEALKALTDAAPELANRFRTFINGIAQAAVDTNIENQRAGVTAANAFLNENVGEAQGWNTWFRGLIELGRGVLSMFGVTDGPMVDWINEQEQRITARRETLNDERQSANREEIDTTRPDEIARAGTQREIAAFTGDLGAEQLDTIMGVIEDEASELFPQGGGPAEARSSGSYSASVSGFEEALDAAHVTGGLKTALMGVAVRTAGIDNDGDLEVSNEAGVDEYAALKAAMNNQDGLTEEQIATIEQRVPEFTNG